MDRGRPKNRGKTRHRRLCVEGTQSLALPHVSEAVSVMPNSRAPKRRQFLLTERSWRIGGNLASPVSTVFTDRSKPIEGKSRKPCAFPAKPRASNFIGVSPRPPGANRKPGIFRAKRQIFSALESFWVPPLFHAVKNICFRTKKTTFKGFVPGKPVNLLRFCWKFLVGGNF